MLICFYSYYATSGNAVHTICRNSFYKYNINVVCIKKSPKQHPVVQRRKAVDIEHSDAIGINRSVLAPGI